MGLCDEGCATRAVRRGLCDEGCAMGMRTRRSLLQFIGAVVLYAAVSQVSSILFYKELYVRTAADLCAYMYVVCTLGWMHCRIY